MAARTPQLALLVDQLVAALQAIPPMLAGNIFIGRRGARINWCCFDFLDFFQIGLLSFL